MKNIILAEGGTSIVNAKKTAKKKYKCPYCEARVERSKLHIHIQNEHEDLIPEGYTALRVAFNTINNKTEGHCIICKGVTDWNEDKARYERLCNNPACHEAYKKIVAERTRKIYGTDRLQTDPAYADYVQRRALEGRKMSGKYTFADGGVLSYMGTYEKRFLEFMDTVMHAKSEDILAPGPSIKYVFQGQNHIYISDFFYVPYNLIIEIKDGGSNRNNHPKRLGEEEEKIKAKEKAVEDLKMFNYVRVTDNDFGQLLSVMALLKYQLYHPTYAYKDDYIIRVNESTSLNENVILNREDIYYNKDKFDSGEINLCFITGHSGSGKSTMGKNMQKKGIEHYELDDLQLIADHFSMEDLKEYGDLIYSYFNGPGKMFYVGIDWIKENMPTESEYEGKLFPGFIHYAMQYAKSHKDKKFVIEGIWLFNNNWFKPSDFKDYAFYIKGTSMIVSKIRAAKRDSGDTKGGSRVVSFTKMMTKNWKHYIRNEKWINNFIDYFSKRMNISEATIDAKSKELFGVYNATNYKNLRKTYTEAELLEDMSGTIGAAIPPARAKAPIVPTPSPMPYETDKDNYYVVQYPKNNAFAYGITKDPLQYSMVSVDPTDKGFYKVYKTDKGKINKKYLTFKIKDKQSGKQLYNELCKIAETSGKIFDSGIKSNYIYETLTEGNVILDPDQMMFDSRFELVDNPKEQERKSMTKIYNWLKGGNLDKLQEQVNELESAQKGEYAYHVLPDGEMSIDQLKQWEHDYLMMPYDQRIISNDISIEKYGSDNLTRYKEKYSKKLQGTDPEKVDIEEASSMIQTQSEDTFTFGAGELDRVKSVECDSSIIIMVLTDRNYGFDDYTSEDIDDLKGKWNRYNALPQKYRVLSSQTAMNIFGLDNDNLFNKAINTYLAKQKHSDDPTESQFSTNECVMPYYIPSDKVLKTNPEGIFNESGYINPYKYTKTLQIMSHSLKCAKTEADRAAIREQIMDYGWNPEIPCTESALRKSYMRFEPMMIQEIDAQSLLESADSNGFTSEYLKDKIVPIFVVLVQGDHLHSKGIRLFTNSDWSHAALSLDSSLDKMYTFRANINDPDNKDHKTGFAIDTVEEYLEDNPHMKSKVYALFITPEQKATIASAINWYIKHQNDTSYGFKNVINILLNRKTKYKNKYEDKCKMVCSQFVYAMLSLVNFKMKNNKDGSTVSPADIDELSNDARFYVVYQGGIDKYDQFKVNDICYKLLPKLPMEMYGINESTGEVFGKPKSVIGKSSSIARIFEMASEMLENF